MADLYKQVILNFFFHGLTFVFFSLICFRFFKYLFPVSFSSDRSALSHPPTIRGMGIIYPIIILIFTFTYNENFNLSVYDLLFIFLCTLVGFWDDLKNINYLKKILLIIGIFTALAFIEGTFLMFKGIHLLPSILISMIMFIFCIIFFNQIDGINGLSSGTFILFLTGLLSFNPSNFIYTNILGMIVFYFLMNVMQVRFFQGDSGAYFLGSIAYLIFKENDELIFISIILLFPILADIVWTTLMRFYFRYNLSMPHKNHLYQNSVTKIKAHFPVTLSHMIFQLILILIIHFWNIHEKSILIQFQFTLIVCTFFSFIYVFSAYSLNKSQ